MHELRCPVGGDKMPFRELARRSGLSRSKLHVIEAGLQAATVEDVRAIADGLGVPLTMLLDDLPVRGAA